MSGRTPSRLRSPTTGSTSKWVRMCVVPWRIAFSSVRVARAWTSSGVKAFFALATSPIASSRSPRSEVQRSRMQDLSRWICVSTNPEETSRPPRSIVSACAASSGSIATILPFSIPMSVVLRSASTSLALLRMRSIESLSLPGLEAWADKFGIAVPRALASAQDNASSQVDMLRPTCCEHPVVIKRERPWQRMPMARLRLPILRMRAERLFDRPILMGEADDEIAEEAVGGEAKRSQAYDADEDLVRCHPKARVEYQIAKAGIRRDHFGGDHGCERIAHGKAHAGQDERQRRRQRHKNECLEGSGAKAGRGAQLVRSDMRHADHGVDQHDEDRRIDDDENFRRLPDAEPDDHRGQPCQRGHETKELHIGVEDRADDGN